MHRQPGAILRSIRPRCSSTLPMRAAIYCTKACHSARVGAGTCRNTEGAPSTETYSLIDAFGTGLQLGHDAAVAKDTLARLPRQDQTAESRLTVTTGSSTPGPWT